MGSVPKYSAIGEAISKKYTSPSDKLNIVFVRETANHETLDPEFVLVAVSGDRTTSVIQNMKRTRNGLIIVKTNTSEYKVKIDMKKTFSPTGVTVVNSLNKLIKLINKSEYNPAPKIDVNKFNPDSGIDCAHRTGVKGVFVKTNYGTYRILSITNDGSHIISSVLVTYKRMNGMIILHTYSGSVYEFKDGDIVSDVWGESVDHILNNI